MTGTTRDVQRFERIRVVTGSFKGEVGVAAYIGSAGISAAIPSLDFGDIGYLPLRWDEFELLDRQPSPEGSPPSAVQAVGSSGALTSGDCRSKEKPYPEEWFPDWPT